MTVERLLLHLRELLARAGAEPKIKLRRVSSADEALALRFLGSPTVRLDGRDIEPGAEERRDYGVKCRLYRTGHGLTGVPPDEWIQAAICARPGLACAQCEVLTGRPMTERLDGVPAPLRNLHRAILSTFIAGRIPSIQTLAQATDSVGVDGLKRMLIELERRDVIRLAPANGSVAVAYPFSGMPTTHRVALRETGVQVYAMCAIDALGIPFLARQPVMVCSRDAGSGEPVETQLDPDRALEWDPPGAVVIVATCGQGPSADAQAALIADRAESRLDWTSGPCSPRQSTAIAAISGTGA